MTGKEVVLIILLVFSVIFLISKLRRAIFLRRRLRQVKEMARLRSSMFFVMNKPIENLTAMELLGLPEATMLSIVDMFSQLKKRGFDNIRALEEIESFRLRSGGGDPSRCPKTLRSYLEYRLQLEYEGFVSVVPKELKTKMIDFAEQKASNM